MVAILVFLTFLILIMADALIVERLAEKKARKMVKGVPEAARPAEADLLAGLHYPNRLHFDRGHTWAGIKNAAVSVGLDDFTQRFTGKIDRIETAKPGDEVQRGQPIWTVRFGNRTITQKAPISGRVVQVNEQALKNPAAVNRSPYGEGWILTILPKSLTEEMPGLLDRGQFRKWNDRIKSRLLELTLPEYGLVSTDSGMLVSGASKEIKPEHWEEVVDLLFDPKE